MTFTENPHSEEGKGLTLTWFGQSMFLMETTRNSRLVIDPFESSLGKTPPRLEADVVLVTHDHYDHNNVGAIGGAKVLRKATSMTFDGIGVEGVDAFHDDSHGSKRGSVVMFKIEAEGIVFLHMGDFGQAALGEDQKQAIGRIDVLMIPVGGFYTIDGKQARSIVQALAPRVAIPMHYKIPEVQERIVGPEGFLEGMRRVVRRPSPLTITKGSLPDETEAWVLDYA
ncbi:MAG: MBL fold metallo-hydrolase [Candidatus Aquicultorales bacterium]